MSNPNFPISIKVPNPCTHDWISMPSEGDGKYCSHCTNIVYDFSGMEDQELIKFFKERPAVSCGRFHNSQLNRDLLPVAKKKSLFIPGLNKLAAALLAVLTFKTTSARSEFKRSHQVTVDSNYKNIIPKSNSNTLITGKITDQHGNPLENAVIRFDSVQVAVSGKDGKFQFELKAADLEFEEPDYNYHNLYFSYDSMVTVVRSYHSAMLSTFYDVAMYKKSKDGEFHSFTMGEMVSNGRLYPLPDLPSVKFRNNSAILNTDTKSLLLVVALKLKENLTMSIEVVGYPGSHQHTSKTRIDNIKNYLINSQGINPDRIRCIYEGGEGDANTVDIKARDL